MPDMWPRVVLVPVPIELLEAVELPAALVDEVDEVLVDEVDEVLVDEVLAEEVPVEDPPDEDVPVPAADPDAPDDAEPSLPAVCANAGVASSAKLNVAAVSRFILDLPE